MYSIYPVKASTANESRNLESEDFIETNFNIIFANKRLKYVKIYYLPFIIEYYALTVIYKFIITKWKKIN